MTGPRAADKAGGDPHILNYPVGMIDEQREAAARQELEAEHERLRERLADLGIDEESALSFDDNFADSAQVAAEQGEVQALVVQLREQLNDVEKALDKLANGGYGLCEACGEPIADARLEAMPATRFCIRHA